MKKVFIVHGFKGEPNGGWKPWLMQELAKLNIYACSLPMPSPDEPKPQEWIETINSAVGDNTEETVLVGHSLGVPAILRYIEQLPKNKKIRGAVLVSGPYKILERNDPNHIVRKTDAFLNKEFDFEKLKSSASYFTVIHGDDDSRVPFSHAEFLSENLHCKLVKVIGGKHFSGQEGFFKLSEALNAVLEIVK